jgi:hypothetical protein
MSTVKPMQLDNLGILLQKQQDASNNISESPEEIVKEDRVPAPITKANKGASLDDFVTMVSMLVTKGMKKMEVEFQPDEGARISADMSKKIDHPYIYYEVIKREPSKELKPRERETIDEITDDKNSRRKGRIYGQRFDCVVQFNFFACDYKTVNKVMNDFEELIFNYSAYLKENGVAEILFKKHFTDKNLDEYRQSLSIRSLQYSVTIEKLFATFDSEIENVSID